MMVTTPPRSYGELVNIGDRRLCARVRGQKGPVVVFENGAGNANFVWSLVEEKVALSASTLAYDRAGIGWSDVGPSPRDGVAIASDLAALLHALALPPPYVIVAHSLAGLYARAFHAAFPADVAGIVFVDAVDEHTHAAGRARAAWHAKARQRASMTGIALADRIGIASALMHRMRPHPALAGRPDVLALRAAFWRGRNRMRGALAEGSALEETAAQVASFGDLGDVPIAVVHSDDAPDFRRIADIWRATQSRLSTLSTRSTINTAAGSGHFVQLDRPDAVIEAIFDVLARTG